MRRIDLLIVGVIVLAIVFSFVGVATYEAVSPETTFDVTWTTKSDDLSRQTKSRTGTGEIQIDLPVNLDNLTKVDLTVDFSGAGPRAATATASIRLVPINASEETKSASLQPGAGQSSAQAQFSIPIRELPNETRESGADDNETLTELAREHTSTMGRGTWQIVVTISGGGAPVLGQNTEAYTITVTGKATTYSASVQPSTPDINR